MGRIGNLAQASLVILAAAAAPASSADCPSPSTVWPTKDWEVSTPEEQGMESAALARLVDFVGRYQQDSLAVIRHGESG